jgi:tetratricopeptide (TPR) repeat protein
VFGLFLAGLSALSLLGCAAPPEQAPEPEPIGLGDPAVLETEMRGALLQNPLDPGAHHRLALALAEQGRIEEADLHFRRAVELDPSGARRIGADRRRYLERAQERAEEQIEAGDLDAARLHLMDADLLVAGDGRTQLLWGRLGERLGDYDSARASYRRAYEIKETEEAREALIRVLFSLAEARYREGRYPEAWEFLVEGEELEPETDLDYLKGTVAYAWAQTLEDPVERGRHLDQAERSFARVLERDPEDEDALYNYAAVLLADERYEEAEEIYARLIEENPLAGDLYMALARAHSLSGQAEPAAAEEAIGRALRTGQPVEDPEVWAERAAERFPDTDLALAYRERFAPDAVYTYTIPGGDLVEAWFYWESGTVEAFREGGRIGSTFHLRERPPVTDEDGKD